MAYSVSREIGFMQQAEHLLMRKSFSSDPRQI